MNLVYGKLALKFENFFKRWLLIFYPREISTSLEEKNRQLMKLMTNRTSQLNMFNMDSNQTIGETNGDHHEQLSGDEHIIMNQDSNEGGDLQNQNNEGDAASTGGSTRKRGRRKINPDKDKYIQEPQYVTKRTSSGRLVKMKISTDYDYTSDQDLENKKKKSKHV